MIFRSVVAVLLCTVTMAYPVHRRYFTQELELPKLESIGPSNRYTQSLPLTYTNDPKIVSQWLGDHISSGDCILGLDVEVGVLVLALSSGSTKGDCG
jgi:hypothetical protein